MIPIGQVRSATESKEERNSMRKVRDKEFGILNHLLCGEFEARECEVAYFDNVAFNKPNFLKVIDHHERILG